VSLSTITDATNATQRLYDVFEAETLEETQIQDPDLKSAIEILGAEFTWDTPPLETENAKSGKRRSKKAPAVPETVKPAKDVPFRVKETNLSIPRGQLIAIVGPVGTGKTSLLQGIIGEMRRTAGTVKFGGTVSYCPQSAWIQVSFAC
jgi:ABC-type transport system involved in cytochrome bd biosynthesis fused ATPase/permease subunit